MDDISQLDSAQWKGGLEMFNRMNSPWFRLLDPDKFEQHVDRVQGLDIEVLASCHSPVIPRSKIDEAFNTIRGIPYGDPPPHPGQPDLEALMHALATGQQYVWQPPSPDGAQNT
jgi:hypothetical protein